MSKTQESVLQLTMDQVWILVVGQNSWGKAPTLEEALAKMASCGGSRRKYLAFLVHKDSWVDDMGSISYPEDFPPREIQRMGARKKARKS